MVNCKHYPMTFIPGLSTLRGEPQSEEENEKTYAESQYQRALERKIREEKRDLEVMKAQGADEDQIKQQRQKIKDVSAEIDDFCEQTGRARRYNRESAPIRATWATDNGDVTRFNRGYIDANAKPPVKDFTVPTPKAQPQQMQPQAPPFVMKYGKAFEGGTNTRTRRYFEEAKQTLDKAPENARRVWAKCADDFKEPSIGSQNSGAFYQSAYGRTYYQSYKKCFEESNYQRKNAVFFHEFGHNIDNLLGSGRFTYYSREYNGGAFTQSLLKECKSAIEQFYLHDNNTTVYDTLKGVQNGSSGMGFGSYVRQMLKGIMPVDEYRAIRDTLYNAGDDDSVLRPLFDKWLSGSDYIKNDFSVAVKNDKDVAGNFTKWVKGHYNIYERSDVSDMFEYYMTRTYGRSYTYPFGVGHGYNYASEDSMTTEAFAEMFSAHTTQNDSLNAIKDFFPESYKMFTEMLEGVQ